MKSNTINYILIVLLISMSKSMIEFQDEKEPPQEFRTAWVSPWGGDADLVTFTSVEQFKENMTYILDTLKMYNMNAIIYHVRTHNDALYKSDLNPVSPYFQKVDFDKFDPLQWMIDETHRRGIEFHAWMNPYRITSDPSIDIETILKKYENYPSNPASKKEDILYGTGMIIMDPGLEEVREFIADTIIEFLNKYDVEAIHFDDYFYADMGAGGSTSGEITILDEPDQNTYNDYIDKHPECPYHNDSATDKADWRREQVDLLISLLREEIDGYNKENKKHVQLGISPTGIYKNGDGEVTYDEDYNAITTGSKTNGQQHYASYLFCDTVKWCNKGWIDYLLPQSYWATDHPKAGYRNVMGWWDKVLKYKKVNLYSGIGLYMADLTVNTYNWQTDMNELYNQLKIVSNSDITQGASIYNFNTFRKYRDGKDTNSTKQTKNGVKAWTKRVPPSEIKSIEKIELEAPQNLRFDGIVLSFDQVKDAKFYVIYRSKEDIKFTEDEIIDIMGDPDDKIRIDWVDINKGDIDYKYGVKALSYSNTLGKGNSVYEIVDEPSQEFRAVWSSPWGGDEELIRYESEEQFKKNMEYILDTLKMYNMNSLIYHVRTHNDALYKSELNPVSPYFEKVDFNKFDPLQWMIDETHRRGIEFHAWMNPYRITSDSTIDIDTIVKRYKDYPKNPASKNESILYGIGTIVMDPGLEEVRTFIADTIIEFLNKYDVEAIHFDDYFYADMGAGGSTSGEKTILDEPDQKTYNDYINTHPECPYHNDSATDKADWRRYQVDLLIILLKDKINEYNKAHKKYVQFGISPTGIYKNGDGVVTYDENFNAITTGSDTNGQQHYASYLFCDTVKWCNNGWIDYLLPQSYWARSHPLAGYRRVMDWWDKVLKYKKVNLYSGIGLYMSDLTGKAYSWQTDYYELYKDLREISYSEITLGPSIYNFATLRKLRDGKDTKSAKQIKNGIKAWTKRLPPSEVKSIEKIVLDAPRNVQMSNNILSFNKVEGAKFYVIYTNKGEIKFTKDEIIDIIGNPENKDIIVWEDKEKTNNQFAVRALSYSNTLGKKKNDDEPSGSTNMNYVSLLGLCCLLILLF